MTTAMTKAEQFEALALRCEQATRPDRELDLAIWRAVTGEPWCWHVGFPAQTVITWDRYGVEAAGNPIVSLDELTTSLDAARSISDAMLIYASDLGADGLPMVKMVADTGTSPVVEHTGIARTLELAWCAAALRARAQMERGR